MITLKRTRAQAMGCDWSKSAASLEELQDAPYSLLSVSVLEGGRSKFKLGKRSAAKKRDKKKASDAAKGQDTPIVPRASVASTEGGQRGAHKPALPSLNLPDRPEGANRRVKGGDVGDDHDLMPNKENTLVLGAGALKPSLGFKLDISKALIVGREPTERQLRKEKLDRYENECTKVEDFMYVGGIRVAQNKELLKGVGITHVIVFRIFVPTCVFMCLCVRGGCLQISEHTSNSAVCHWEFFSLI